MNSKFNLFLESVDEGSRGLLGELNDCMVQGGCKCEIKEAKSGYVVSYILSDSKKTLATFVCRKSGVKIRMYPQYGVPEEDFLNSLPSKMKKDIQKASVCKRLIDPNDCNPKCVMGYQFVMDGVMYQKCRYMAFMPNVNQENHAYIMKFLEISSKKNSGIGRL